VLHHRAQISADSGRMAALTWNSRSWRVQAASVTPTMGPMMALAETPPYVIDS